MLSILQSLRTGIQALRALFASRHMVVLIEIAAPLIALAIQVVLLREMDRFRMRDEGELRFAAILLAASPGVFFYFLLRLISRPVVALLITASATVMLRLAANMKLAMSNDVLTWSDISSTANLSIVAHYFSLQHFVVLAVLVGVCVLLAYLVPKPKRTAGLAFFHLAALTALFPLAFYPHSHVFGDGVGARLESLAARAGVTYAHWDWLANVRSNGLLVHLVQTSTSGLPDGPDAEELAVLERLSAAPAQPVAPPDNVIVVLCESCWHDEAFFRSSFAVLRDQGFREFRATSPAFGGRTVNASFELLTGLPSKGALSGVIYQEYAGLLSDAALSYPRSVQQQHGFATTAMHNHVRRFWKRDIVKPKLGFDRFVGIEDMGHSSSTWADDRILYDAAKAAMAERSARNYLFLTTVFLHGPFPFNGDFGESDYRNRLDLTMDRLASFTGELIGSDEDVVILVVGDHKPAMTRFFYEKGVIPADQFETVGRNDSDFRFVQEPAWHLVGDVPGYIYARDPERVEAFLRDAQRRPFYCVAHAVNTAFLGVQLPAYAYAREHGLCREDVVANYADAVTRFPGWLYAASLFPAG